MYSKNKKGYKFSAQFENNSLLFLPWLLCSRSLSRIGLTVSPIKHMIMYKNLSLSILYIDNCAQTLDTLEKTNNPISFRLEWKSSLINYFYIQIRTYIYIHTYMALFCIKIEIVKKAEISLVGAEKWPTFKQLRAHLLELKYG